MSGHDFNALLWFLAVARERSFTKAAAKLGIAQSTLSHAIKGLESDTGLRLLTRTTRNVSLTAAGERLRATMAPRVQEIEAEIDDLMSLRDQASGSVRITLSEHALETIVWPKLQPVLAAHPDIQVELNADIGFLNIVENGFDAGVRLGESVEKDMVAVRIGPDWRLVAVASPAYFARRAKPTHPRELVAHNCMNLRQKSAGGLYHWEFSKRGQELRVKVAGQLTFSNTQSMLGPALAGYGIAYLPEDAAMPHVRAGELEIVLDDWSPPFDGYFLYYPRHRQSLPAFQIIVEALRHRQSSSARPG